jgi:hypothetical protein
MVVRPPQPPGDPVREAEQLAHHLLHDVGSRWVHTQAVVDRARTAARALPTPPAATTLLVAAWLHDIGYAPALRDTGFHPLDGARWLTGAGWSMEVAGLVAHHSAAHYVAEARGLQDAMSPYDDPSACTGPVADALTWADQTTGPSGQLMDVRTRLDEMLRRHGTDSPNARCHAVRAPAILSAVARTETAVRRRSSLVRS